MYETLISGICHLLSVQVRDIGIRNCYLFLV